MHAFVTHNYEYRVNEKKAFARLSILYLYIYRIVPYHTSLLHVYAYTGTIIVFDIVSNVSVLSFDNDTIISYRKYIVR